MNEHGSIAAESAPKRERLQAEVIRRRHDTALRIWALEDALMDPAFDKTAIDAAMAGLPEPLRERAETSREDAERENERVNGRMDLLCQFDKKSKTHTPESLGAAFFRARAGSAPSGTVRIDRHGLVLVALAENRDDYAAMVGENVWKAESVGTSSGIVCKDVEVTHIPKKFEDRGYFGSVPMVCEEPVDGIRPAETTSIVDHEIQHFVNDELLGGFGIAEGKANHRVWSREHEKGKEMMETLGLVRTRQYLKNELFAFLRGGSTPREIFEQLDSGSYAAARERISDWGLRDETREAVRKCYSQLEREPAFARPTARRTLIAMLADVPLIEMHRWLEAAVAYYKPLLESAQQSLRHQGLGFSSRRMLAADRNGRAAPAIAAADDLRRRVEAYEDAVFTTESDRQAEALPPAMREVAESARQLGDAWAQLEREGLPATCYSPSFYRDRHPEVRGETLEETKLLESLLARVNEISQEIHDASPSGPAAVRALLQPVADRFGAEMEFGNRLSVRSDKDGSIHIRPTIFMDPEDRSAYTFVEIVCPAARKE